MTTKPAVDYRRVLQELIDLWDSELKERTVEVRGDFEHEIVPLAVYSSVAHAVECGKGVLTLYRASLPVPAVPLIRTLIEDSVTAAWLIVAPGAWQAYASAGADERGKTIRRVMKERPEDVRLAERNGEMTNLTEHLGTPKKWRFDQRAAQLEGADDVYTYYRIASALSHAGFGIADLYAKTDPRDKNEAILLNYPAHAAASSWIAVAAGAVLQALIAWDHARPGRPHEIRLTAIADRIGVSSTIRLRVPDETPESASPADKPLRPTAAASPAAPAN
jgi:hypothetical protein